MKNIIMAAAIFSATNAGAVGPLINGNQINPQTAISIATFTVTGAGGMSFTNSVTASSFTASGSGFNGAGTGLTGTAASLTSGNVTTNANLTGDVTSAGNATTAAATQANIKTLSGLTTISNSFTVPSPSSGTFAGALGATGQVHLSTGSTVFFASSLGFTSSQTSFTPSASVTGSTVSFVVQGTTVACWLAGTISANSSGAVQVSIGVDGAVNKIPGTSSSVAITEINVTGNGIVENVSFPPVEFQVSAGASHSFWLGIWSAGATTVTFPETNMRSIAQFGCREVLSR
jgi:hypothetical protein